MTNLRKAAGNMIVYERLASIEKLLEEAKKLPLSSKVIVDADELGILIKEIKISLPEELKQARWVSGERKKIITNAHVEAEDIITEAHEKIEEHELVVLAKEKADKILEKTGVEADAIKEAALNYTDRMLNDVQQKLEEFVDIIIKNRMELK